MVSGGGTSVIGRHSTHFFDASVLVAGSHSPTGGSGLILEACRLGGSTAQVSVAVVSECLAALADMSELSLARFDRLLSEVHWRFVPVPPEPVLRRYEAYVDPGDAHVLAAAAEAGSDCLLSLDRRHLVAAGERVLAAGLRTIIVTLGDFTAGYYDRHEALHSLPQPRT